MSDPHNQRDGLAEKLADRILLHAIGSAACSGLLLARPENIEHARFISGNLQSALRRRGALVLYASLDRATPAHSIISGVVYEAIQRLAGSCQAGAVPGADEVVNSAAADPENLVGIDRAVSLCSALVRLSELSRRVIVIIIDDAQQLQDTSKGQAMLYALKAARDEINSSKHRGLRIVLSGVDKERLARLCRERDQAFYCAPMIDIVI
ncbi:hypothetical protein V0R52_08915 [Pseudomonas asiatica]|uniref:hypothetical protein n=1 Tax=Pseudomonas asiatica TaxID=2219225 RepID=UPI002E7C409B|nr:hypothetical protein [Pseudomonas asiatica]MEE1916512.1 hypothetical protein [Pseudomonas asiatica]